jgi:cytochrome o ubiquinol oxidase operon protein cyoD
MKQPKPTQSRLQSPGSLTLNGYVTGYVASLFLTLTAYLTVRHHLFGRHGIIAAVVVLAVTQLVVQLLYFLHLGSETKPRWRLYVFWFMLMVVVIIVLGSVWIITDLNTRHTLTPSQVNTYLQSQDGL